MNGLTGEVTAGPYRDEQRARSLCERHRAKVQARVEHARILD